MKRSMLILFLLAVFFAPLSKGHTAEWSIYQLTDNDIRDSRPSLHNGAIAWRGWDGNDYEIYYWDGSSITQVTQNGTYDSYPSLCNGTIAWRGWDGNDYEIYYWDGSSITQVTQNGTYDGDPSLYDGTSAWSASDVNSDEIYYWDGSSITQVTDDNAHDQYPSLCDGTIAWHKYDVGNGYQICYWDGSSITQVTNNDSWNQYPSLYDGTIAWQEFNVADEYQICYWDGSSITQVTNNDSWNQYPSLYDGTIAWSGDDGNDQEIYYWDGSSITQVTNNESWDQYPSLHNGTIAWSGDDGNDQEIYYAVQIPEPNISELVPDHGGYGTKIRVMGSGFGHHQSGMLIGQDGHYSFITFAGDSDTMIATEYPFPANPVWSRTEVAVRFKEFFIDANGNYLQDEEPSMSVDQFPPGSYTVTVHTIWFHDLNRNGVYDAGDEVYDAFSSNSQAFNLLASPEPIISVSPTSHDFGRVDLGRLSIKTKTFLITNTGDADVNMEPPSITGADASAFSFQNDNCSNHLLRPGDTCTLDVTFSPTSEGSKSANLSISSYDDLTLELYVPVAVPLSGTGVIAARIDSVEITNWQGEPQLEFEATEAIMVTVRYGLNADIETAFDDEEKGVDVEFPVKAKIILKVGEQLFVADSLFTQPGTDHYTDSLLAGSCGYGTKKVVGWLKILKGGTLLGEYRSEIQYVTVLPTGPTIFKRLPDELKRFDVLKIWGANFGADQGDGVVRIGLGWEAASDTLGLGEVLDGYLKWTDTVIKVKLRVGAAYQNKIRYIWVEKDGKKSNYKPIEILPD